MINPNQETWPLASNCVGPFSVSEKFDRVSDFRYVLVTARSHQFSESLNRLCFIVDLWGGRRGLNPRHSVPQTVCKSWRFVYLLMFQWY